MKILWTVNMNTIFEDILEDLGLVYWRDGGIFKAEAVMSSAYTINKASLINLRKVRRIPDDVEIYIDSGGARIISLGESKFDLTPERVYWIAIMAGGNYVFTLDVPVNVLRDGLDAQKILKCAEKTRRNTERILRQMEGVNRRIGLYLVLQHFSNYRPDLTKAWFDIAVKPFIEDDRVVGLGIGTQQVALRDVDKVVFMLRWLGDEDLGRIRRIHFFAVMGARALVFYAYSKANPHEIEILSFDGDHSWYASYGRMIGMDLGSYSIPYVVKKLRASPFDPSKCRCKVCERWDKALEMYRRTGNRSVVQAWSVAHTAYAFYNYFRKAEADPERTAVEYGLYEEYYRWLRAFETKSTKSLWDFLGGSKTDKNTKAD